MTESHDKTKVDDTRLAVKVVGDFACFTRPDMKVERMSYPCMTPSAARGILDCILWKPEFRWYVRRILVLRPVNFTSVKRNELSAKQGASPLYIEALRTQRISILLRDVAYIIEASIFQDAPNSKNPARKYVEMFQRRVRKGQCFRRPYLGTREFSCEFMEPDPTDTPVQDTIPIGSLFYDMYYGPDGKPQPLFASDMAIRQGVLDCENAHDIRGNLNERLMTSSHLCPPVDAGVRPLLAFYAEQEKQEEQEATHA